MLLLKGRLIKQDLDMKSSLFLEQAAVCFLQSYPCAPRKYIFHLILAGHRFIKCGHVNFLSFMKLTRKADSWHSKLFNGA